MSVITKYNCDNFYLVHYHSYGPDGVHYRTKRIQAPSKLEANRIMVSLFASYMERDPRWTYKLSGIENT